MLQRLFTKTTTKKKTEDPKVHAYYLFVIKPDNTFNITEELNINEEETDTIHTFLLHWMLGGQRGWNLNFKWRRKSVKHG